MSENSVQEFLQYEDLFTNSAVFDQFVGPDIFADGNYDFEVLGFSPQVYLEGYETKEANELTKDVMVDCKRTVISNCEVEAQAKEATSQTVTDDLLEMSNDDFDKLLAQFVFDSSTKKVTPTDIWKVRVEQVDPKSGSASFNFRTLLRIMVELNGRLVNFQPIHIGFISAKKNRTISILDNSALPTQMALKWERFGHRTYKNKSCKGTYLVVLQVSRGSTTHNLGLAVQVDRNNQPGSSNTKDLPVVQYSWFEIGNVQSFIDETNPQLLSLWSESLVQEGNRVITGAFCPDNKDIPTGVAPQKEKRICSTLANKRKNVN